MSYCFGVKSKGYISNLTQIQKLIPHKYLLYECLLNNKRTFMSLTYNDELKIYSENGLLKQLDLFKKFKNKFEYIKLEDNIFIIPKSKPSSKKSLCLFLYLMKKKSSYISFIAYILSNQSKKTTYNIKTFQFINKYKMKTPSKLNAKEEFEYKKKKLTKSKKLAEFKEQLELDYKEASDIIKKYEKNDKFKKYYKKESKKFKTKSFEKEIKAIKKSIFFTCKVATKYKKLFPNY